MSYSEIVIRNKENLEAYYYARKCMDMVGVQNNASKAFNENVFENFLQEIFRVKQKYNRNNSDSLNVFWMLNLAYKEQAHSAFIGELLNPRGVHGKKGAFLELFCKQMNVQFSPNTYKLLEYSFAKGRLDVYLPCINNPSCEIVIEDKINASDGNSQIKKYRDFFPNSNLFYLTLNGKEASLKSTCNENIKYKPISYKKDVLEWLKKCKELCNSSQDVALLKMIEQYEDVVRMLTGEMMSDDESKDVLDIFQKNVIPLECLKNDDCKIENEFEKHLVELIRRVAVSIGAETIEEGVIKNDECKTIPSALDKKFSGVSFKFKEWNDFIARLEFQKNRYREIFYGVRYIGKDCLSERNILNLKSVFKGYFDQKNKTGEKSKKFLVGAYWLRYKNWNADCFLRALDGSFEKDLVDFLENIKYYMKVCLPEEKCSSS